MRVASAAAQLHRRAGVADDRAHDVEADAGKRRRRDTPLDAANIHRLRHFAQHRAGQRGEAADTRQNKDARRFGRGVEAIDPEDEIGTIGKVEIVDACRDARLDDMVTTGAIVLERARGVDDEFGREASKGIGDVAPVQRAGNHTRLALVADAEGFGAGGVAAADQQFEIGAIGQQFGEPPAEDAIAAQNQDLLRHNMRSLYSGGAIQQLWRLPKKRYRLRAIQR